MSKKKPRIETPVVATAAAPSVSTSNFYNWSRWALLVFGFLLYANTLGHDYTQDDAIVIYDNMYTTQGVSGIPGLLTKDTFFGFFKEEGKANLVSGGRYRPLTPVMFALEYQIFGKNPFVGHCINALLYGLLGVMIFMLFTRIFSIRNDHNAHFKYVVLACSLLFIAHPVHTEAVANIKGRDEIMSMMGAVLATLFVLKNWAQYNVRNTWVAFGAFFLALMSKENAITFLAVVPAILWLFYASPVSRIFSLMLPLLGATILFLIIRTAVLGLDMGGTPMELMNNPFLKWDGQQYVAFTFMEKSATIIYTLGKYLMLLIFPHPLTHDYYPRHIDIMSFSQPGVILSLLAYAAMFWALWFFYKKNKVVVFALFFFMVTLSIVSNVVFPIGTNMSERFLFMPSLGFCLLIPEILYAITKKGRVVLNLCMIAVVAFSLKTVTRNPVWKNDFTLFTTDVEVSKNSAKVLNAAGGALSTEAVKVTDVNEKTAMLQKALIYLNRAVLIHPRYKNAYLLMGNCHYYLNDFDKSILAYEAALKIDPQFKDARNNLAVSYRDAGRNAGERQRNITLAESLLLKSYSINPTDTETLRLLGVAYGMSGQHQKAIAYFGKVVELDPKNAAAFLNLSSAYQYMGDTENANKYRAIALQLDPTVGQKK